jgi:hypothetical protein
LATCFKGVHIRSALTLAQGLVYNAVDACAKLGIDGEQMDRIWAAAKDAGKLVKFGGEQAGS